MARSNTKRNTGHKTYAILVDGQTEKWYLDKLRVHEKPRGISIKPDLPQRTSLEEQFEKVKANAVLYDVSVWMVDLDVIIAENKVAIFNRYLTEAEKHENIRILVNTPCLEYWFLQHVDGKGKFYPNCQSVVTALKKYEPLKAYAKSMKYFINHPDIYQRLKPHLNNAITNAAARGDYDPQHPKQGKAEIYKLFEILGLAISA